MAAHYDADRYEEFLEHSALAVGGLSVGWINLLPNMFNIASMSSSRMSLHKCAFLCLAQSIVYTPTLFPEIVNTVIPVRHNAHMNHTARSMARRCARRHTRTWYLPLGCAWCHPGAAAEALEAVPPLGIAAPTPKRSTTQPIPASRAPPESPMGTRCPPPPPRLQASRSTTSSARGAASRRTSAAPSRVQH